MHKLFTMVNFSSVGTRGHPVPLITLLSPPQKRSTVESTNKNFICSMALEI